MQIKQNVADLIRQDHREMERLFAELRDPQKRVLTAPAILALLAAHSRAEEAEVYPAIAKETDAADKVAHSQEEHAEADQLVEKLVAADPTSAKFDELLDKLVKAVTHHIGEEEETVLPAADQLPQSRQYELATAFVEHRANELWGGVADLSRLELEQQARNEGITGIGSLSKEELQEKVSD